jgi:hypothetical protein
MPGHPRYYFYKAESSEGYQFNIKDVLDGIYLRERGDKEVDIKDNPCFLSQTLTRKTYNAYLFTKVRMTELPSVIRSDGTYEDIELDDDEGLGEDVALGCGPLENIVSIQSNRYSLSPKNIANIINNNRPEIGINFVPIMRQDALSRFRRIGIFKKFRLKLAKVNNLSSLANSGHSVADLIELQESFQDPYIEIALSVGRTKGECLGDKVRRWANALAEFVRSDSAEGVRKLEVTGIDTDTDERLIVDLITDKFFYEGNIEPAGRYTNTESLMHAACAALEENHHELSHINIPPS